MRGRASLVLGSAVGWRGPEVTDSDEGAKEGDGKDVGKEGGGGGSSGSFEDTAVAVEEKEDEI